AAALPGESGGVSDAALDAGPGVQRLFRGYLERGAAVDDAAGSRVHALGVLADDDEIEVVRAGSGYPRPLPGGAQVHVEGELEAKAKEQAGLEHSGGDRRTADGAEEDGISLLQVIERVVRQNLAGSQVVLGAERAGPPVDREAMPLACLVDQIAGDRRDLRADAVARQVGDDVAAYAGLHQAFSS